MTTLQHSFLYELDINPDFSFDTDYPTGNKPPGTDLSIDLAAFNADMQSLQNLPVGTAISVDYRTYLDGSDAATAPLSVLTISGENVDTGGWSISGDDLVNSANAAAIYDFYIGPGGSDSNPGTLNLPWSINAINTKQATYAGLSVGVLPGTYNVYALLQALSGGGSQQTAALWVQGGTTGFPTLIQSTTAGLAIITGANPSGGGYPTVAGGMIGQGGGNIPGGVTPSYGNVIIDGFYITRGYQYGVNFYLNSTIVTARSQGDGGATGIEVRNCEIFDIAGVVDDNVAGVFLQNCTGAWIHNNKIHSVQPSTGGNATDVAGIFSYACYSNLYELNTIYDCNQGFRDKGATGDPFPNGNHTLQYNYVEVNGLFPIAALGDGNGGSLGDAYTVRHNIFNVIGAGAALWYTNVWPSNASENSGQAFYQNTCIFPAGGNGAFLPAGGTNVSPTAKVDHYNNVYKFSGNPASPGVICVVAGAIDVSDFNLFGPEDGYFGIATYASPDAPSSLITLAAWQSANGCDAHSGIGSPTFVNPTSLNPAGFALQHGTLGSAASSTRPGRVGGLIGGALCDMGAWGGAVPPTQIGCNIVSADQIAAGVLGVQATDHLGNIVSFPQQVWSIVAPSGTDTMPPTIPTGLTITPALNALNCTIDAPSDNYDDGITPSGPSHCNVYLGGVKATPPSPVDLAVSLSLPLTATNIGAFSPLPTAVQLHQQWTLTAAGTGFNQTPTEQCLFVGAEESGDAFMIVKVNAFTSTNQYSTAGIMIREARSQGAKFAAWYLQPSSPGLGLQMKNRLTTGGNGVNNGSVPGITGPVWLKIQRSATTLTFSYSLNGTKWTIFTSITLSMNQVCSWGLVLASQTAGTTCTTAFSEVNLNDNPAVSFTIDTTSTEVVTVTSVDADGNESAPCNSVTATPLGSAPPPPTGIKKNFGHYVALDQNASLVDNLAHINSDIAGTTNCVGVYLIFNWSSLENNEGEYAWGTQGDPTSAMGIYAVQLLIAACVAHGLQFQMGVQSKQFSGGPVTSCSTCPPYFATLVCADGAPGYILATAADFSSTGDLAATAKNYDPVITARYAALVAAYGQGTGVSISGYTGFDGVANFECWNFSDETSNGLYFSDTPYNEQIVQMSSATLSGAAYNWASLARAAFPTSGVRFTTNFTSGTSETTGQFQTLFNNSIPYGIIMGGPDLSTALSSPNDLQVFNGYLGGTSYVNNLPFTGEEQSCRGFDQSTLTPTLATLYAFYMVNGARSAGGQCLPNYFVWHPWDGTYYNTTTETDEPFYSWTEVKAFIEAGNPTNTTTPESYS